LPLLIGWKLSGGLDTELTADMRLQGKFALFNAISKIAFVALFLLLMPFVLERINIINTDNDLISKREIILNIIEENGIEPFTGTQDNSFGSYNVLKEEYISLEKFELDEFWNFIEVTSRLIEDEEIDYRVLNYSFYVDGEMYLLEIGKSLSSIRQTEKNIRWIALVLLLLFVAVTLLVDVSYIRFLLKPLDQIVHKKLKDVNDPELFIAETIKTTTEDFRMLDQTINQMMERIQVLFRKEREFTSNVSHELLTPVSVLQSKLENLLNESSMSQDAMIKISESLRTLGRLKNIVNSLLLIARIENEQYLKNETVNINELVKEVILELKDQFEAAEIQLHTDLEAGFTISGGNRALLFTMFLNILGNALKYSSKKGSVSVTSYNEGANYKLEIHNTGEGIAPENLGEIFSRFRKFSSESIQGFGLGLPISKTIAEFHGISMSARSEKNKGTTFCLIF
jgi:signal transduction histidine kinase